MNSPDSRGSWQFDLRSLFALTTLFALLFAVARAARLSGFASLVAAIVLTVSLLGGFALVKALVASLDDDGGE